MARQLAAVQHSAHTLLHSILMKRRDTNVILCESEQGKLSPKQCLYLQCGLSSGVFEVKKIMKCVFMCAEVGLLRADVIKMSTTQHYIRIALMLGFG